MKNEYKIVVNVTEGKTRLGKSKFGVENIMEMVLKKGDKQVWAGFMLVRIDLCGGL